MKKIVFFSFPHWGHVNPIRNLIKDLINTPCEVLVYTRKNFTNVFEELGCRVLIYNLDIYEICFPFVKDIVDIEENHSIMNRLQDIAYESRNMIQFSKALLQYLLPSLYDFGPDLIIYDSFCMWGKLASDKLKVMDVCVECFFVYNKDIFCESIMNYIKFYNTSDYDNEDILLTKIYNIIQSESRKISRTYGIANYSIIKGNYSDNLNLVLIERKLQPYDTLLNEKYIFIEDNEYTSYIGKEYIRNDIPLKGNVGKIFITFGREKSNYIKDIILKMCAYLTEYEVVITTPMNNELKYITSKYSNIHISDFVNQQEELNKCDLFISHAGITGIKEALLFSVPMILYPTTFLQQLIANKLEENGYCRILELSNVTESELNANVKQLIAENKKAKCGKLNTRDNKTWEFSFEKLINN